MKIILSKKGVDSSYGGFPIDIDKIIKYFNNTQSGSDMGVFPMITLPIPQESNERGEKYTKLFTPFGQKNLAGLYTNIVGDKIYYKGKKLDIESCYCHPDPYIVKYYENADYIGSFGPSVRHASPHLKNQNVGIGDLFLFYGWYKFHNKPIYRQVIFGYLQVGYVLTGDKTYKQKILCDYYQKVKKEQDESLEFSEFEMHYYKELENIIKSNKIKKQPHISKYFNNSNIDLKSLEEQLAKTPKETIYIASENLKIGIDDIDSKKLKGFGMFEYNSEIENNNKTKLLTLTNLKENSTKTQWLVEKLANCHPSWSRNAFDKNGNLNVYFMAQEMVLDVSKENSNQIEWLKELFIKCKVKNC